MHERGSDSSTIRVANDIRDALKSEAISSTVPVLTVRATLWVHDDSFSQQEVLVCPSILSELGIQDGDLIEIVPYVEKTETRDFEKLAQGTEASDDESVSDLDLDDSVTQSSSRCLCITRVASSELMEKHKGLEVTMTRTLANAFGFRSRSHIHLSKSEIHKWTASHVELSFRDAYLARSDMWRLACQELAGKVLYKGQKLTFLGTMKIMVKSVHVRGHHVPTGYFSTTTIPVFRSEAARYVIFIQMSREMWDFDSEGNGEIMFNKVINGFLPDLFRRWVALEVRHLVSIVMFGRLEYEKYDLGTPHNTSTLSQASSVSNSATGYHQDFYRVVVTDMASAQWTTILDELKKDFRVFLRDMSLQIPTPTDSKQQDKTYPPKITGRPSTALKGNILEAINIASSQFANDYIDRDLIRTGVSTVVITAGTGVYDVDRDLLNLTSENLTNNGIGIDIVCLSKMPLHSVPLFKYTLSRSRSLSRASSSMSAASYALNAGAAHPSLPSLGHSPAYSSFTSTSANYFEKFPGALSSRLPQEYGFGVPQWIDLSYWSPELGSTTSRMHKRHSRTIQTDRAYNKQSFVPRVRMYELQMMGLMELGMADISIPYMSETSSGQTVRRKRIYSDITHLTKTLSQSPTYLRKDRSSATRTRDAPAGRAFSTKILNNSFATMDEYDTAIFRNIDIVGREQKSEKSKKHRQTSKIASQSTSVGKLGEHKHIPNIDSSSILIGSTQVGINEVKNSTETTEKATKPIKPPPRISRTISYALRGLAPPLRAAASTEVNIENAKAQPSTVKTSLAQSVSSTHPDIGRADSIRSSDHDRDSLQATERDNQSILSSDTVSENPTKPISIGGSGLRNIEQKKTSLGHNLSKMSNIMSAAEDSSHHKSKVSSLSSSVEDAPSDTQSLERLSDSVPPSTLPFIRNVNASNPLKKHPNAASAFGRWQHLYPHKPHSSTVKWRSLCTPASVPLTTEDFPSLEDLDTEYSVREHTVSLRNFKDILEEPITITTLFQEMIALRLAHGYQVVTGDVMKTALEKAPCRPIAILDPKSMEHQNCCVYMCMGSTLQKISFTDNDRVHIAKYVRKSPHMDQAYPQLIHYTPYIRTILSIEYVPRPMQLRGVSEEYPWETADNFLAAGGLDQIDKADELRFWRARFVLLPVEPPPNAYRSHQQHSEDNDEEIHLLGIRALTQMWQRARFVSQDEKKLAQSRMGSVRRKDQNPLEIKIETLNPSEVVATELDKLLTLEESGEVHSTQLLPEIEKLDRETPMPKLAQAMQGEKGIEIKNRRWHFKLHYNCFHGEEFTNWLAHNVKNIETRHEAVEFGNQLMKEGLFEHVNGRHNFKDGTYFYSLKPEFRTPRLDLKGPWYATGRRSEKSIPPTPLSEHPSREQGMMTTRSRSGSSLAFQLHPSTPSEMSKYTFDRKKKTVSLSKMIRIDVNPRKRSNRSEVVNLHYDRLHNPENCYHIELSWLNVTSKLVDDAIVSWTTQAETYGLKLVEVPIAEASEVPNREPFRSCYRIKLALEPPKRAPFHNIFTTNSFAPQPTPTPDVHHYHKQLLKKFNFVLDLEAASEYPENVDIQYSWGRLEYKYTQFVHRTGIGLAQITTDGDILLLANRLYNSRLAPTRDSTMRFESKRDSASATNRLPPNKQLQAQMQASGIIAPHAQSPTLSPFSPTVKATADVLGIRAATKLPGSSPSAPIVQYVTPEQIKDEIESFCSDPTKLEQFYREVNAAMAAHAAGGPTTLNTNMGGNGTAGITSAAPLSSSTTATNDRRRGTGSTGSSLLRPIREPSDLPIEGIPAFDLSESMASPAGSGTGSTHNNGFGLGLGMLKRARGSVMYDSVAEMFGGGRREEREGSATGTGSKSGSVSGEGSGVLGPRNLGGGGGGMIIEGGIANAPRSPGALLAGLKSPKRRSTGSSAKD